MMRERHAQEFGEYMPNHSTPLSCLSLENSGSVSASAGSGKTWLLVSRIVRLLLADQAPRHIVAITFTRKAAGEMRQRLNQRLLQFVSVNEAELEKLLQQIGLSPNPDLMRRARSLYDNLLRQTHSVHCTTFHAFCQSLLQSFPLEAEIAPGFALIEDSSALQNVAIDSFVNDCTQAVNSDLSRALLSLIDRFGSPAVCFSALRGFFNKRLDWQLFTQHQPQPAHFAAQQLRQQMGLTSDEYQIDAFLSAQRVLDLEAYLGFLNLNTNSDKAHGATLDAALLLAKSNSRQQQLSGFEQISRVLLTKENQARVRNSSAAQEKRLGGSGQQRFLELHASLSEQWRQQIDVQLRYRNFDSNRAWYACGQRILDIYHQLKAEQALLDFDDLEWHTYLLLFQSEAADWVQYRLDSRIDHILVDEFQDTNHFQWRLLHALLQEMSAGLDERQRSCFIVGDTKQSIYGFRRAEPALFTSAANWLKQAMQAQDYPLSTSWRSSPVIMQLVNCVFGDGRLGIENFPQHHTHLTTLNGCVEILPLIEKPALEQNGEQQEAALDFRNPLTTPVAEESDDRYYREACRMAAIIKSLTDTGHPLSGEILNYDDIMILVRSRTHTHHYERAFRENHIPYAGGGKANMFECLEIQDILALLECLATPYKNLSLAHVLRSPIFDCSEQEIQRLVGSDSSWYEKLLQTAWSDQHPGLQRAQQLLPQWSDSAAILPTHDAIDLIYHQSDIFRCYQKHAPGYLQGRIRQNLLQVMDMALEIDSGRYPSMEKFIWRLHQIKNADSEEPKESLQLESGNLVKILTIHAAKGLEAKAVFLADAAYSPKDQSTYQACVKWPVDEEKPTHFMLLPSKTERDQVSAGLAQYEQSKSVREQANLLYVALTRAKQYLYISAVKPSRGEELSWYGAITQQCQQHDFTHDDGRGTRVALFAGEKTAPPDLQTRSQTSAKTHSTTALRPIPHYAHSDEQANSADYVIPSQLGERDSENDFDDNTQASTRGTFIHKALDGLCAGYAVNQLRQLLDHEFAAIDADQRQAWLNEALANFGHTDLQAIFANPAATQSYSELAINYYDNSAQRFVMGSADRVVVLADSVLLVDYKSVPIANQRAAEAMSSRFVPQLDAYAKGLQQIWPDKPVKRFILFTALSRLIEI